MVVEPGEITLAMSQVSTAFMSTNMGSRQLKLNAPCGSTQTPMAFLRPLKMGSLPRKNRVKRKVNATRRIKVSIGQTPDQVDSVRRFAGGTIVVSSSLQSGGLQGGNRRAIADQEC